MIWRNQPNRETIAFMLWNTSCMSKLTGKSDQSRRNKNLYYIFQKIKVKKSCLAYQGESDNYHVLQILVMGVKGYTVEKHQQISLE